MPPMFCGNVPREMWRWIAILTLPLASTNRNDNGGDNIVRSSGIWLPYTPMLVEKPEFLTVLVSIYPWKEPTPLGQSRNEPYITRMLTNFEDIILGGHPKRVKKISVSGPKNVFVAIKTPPQSFSLVPFCNDLCVNKNYWNTVPQRWRILIRLYQGIWSLQRGAPQPSEAIHVAEFHRAQVRTVFERRVRFLSFRFSFLRNARWERQRLQQEGENGCMPPTPSFSNAKY